MAEIGLTLFMGLGFAITLAVIGFALRGRRACLYEADLLLAAPPAQALQRCLQALTLLDPGAKVLLADEERVEARLPLSWKSWGERIRFELTPTPEGTRVRAGSWCRLPTNLADWGRNQENVRRLVAALELSGPHAPVSPQLAPRAGAGGRCPFCHDLVSAQDAVACTHCLARHHGECWDEHAQCASCGSTSRYGAVEQTAGRGPSEPGQHKA